MLHKIDKEIILTYENCDDSENCPCKGFYERGEKMVVYASICFRNNVPNT